jgi:hypothetical protein
MKIYLSILILYFACISATANADTLTIAALQDDEEIKIELISNGCFHNTKFLYVFRGGKTKLLDISQADYKWNAEKKEIIDQGGVKLGTITLKGEDESGLDYLLQFYRMKNEGGCTTTDNLTVEYIRAGQLIGKEEFVDSTCSSSMIRMMQQQDEYRNRFGEPKNWAFLKQIIFLDEMTARLKK